ncbi:MAG: M42 family peptidase [Chloroflexi bacterium]|nr:M42 family peptidase [Chloroflexota bacterium]MDL1885857.1 M42 family metallopeptidase [Anaerolineae bacterium CFX8]
MLLRELSEAIGVSGQEDAVRKLILPAIQEHVTDIRVDALGSITAVKPGSDPNAPRVMVAAHMDEVGFMVTGFDGDGLIHVAPVGGIDERILPGLRVKIGENHVPGVIVWTPIHKSAGNNTPQKINALRIDIGASSKEEASGKVKRGDRVAFDSRYMELGDHMLRGKSFDNRVGCSLLVELLQGGPYPVTVLAAFTVQEEIGLRGARVAARVLNPDAALVIEGTTANDLPSPTAEPDDEDEINPACRLGAGPALTIMDRSMITDPRLLAFLRQTAESAGIPYQLKTQLGGGTDAGAIHMMNGGIPSAVISVPCRYIHSPTAYLHRDDYANTLRLLQAALKGFDRAILAR